VAFGKAMARLRMTRELKQNHIARATGLTKAMISAFETGKVSPSLESLFAYLGAVGCNLADLQRELDKPGWLEAASLVPNPDDVYRRIGKAVARIIEEISQDLEVVATEVSSSEQPPDANSTA